MRLGSERHYPEEAPVLQVDVPAFALETHAVSNARFAAFVDATGYRTLAEQGPDPADFPGADPALLVPGSLVFVPPTGPVDLRVPTWWAWVPGAHWRAPGGPGTDLAGREDHPVVHVAHADAEAYARWAGRDLPTEGEWEHAARGGLVDADYAWGDELHPQGRRMANTWEGDFPRTSAGWGTTPGGAFPPNGYGLYDMIGNVWEWTSTSYRERRSAAAPCCAPTGNGVPAGGPQRLVLKGGSYLCAPSYCARYRPAARVGQDAATSTGHTGFRCVLRP